MHRRNFTQNFETPVLHARVHRVGRHDLVATDLARGTGVCGMETHPIKNLYEALSFGGSQLRFTARRLFSPLGGRNDERDKLRFDLQLQEILIGDGGETH